MAVKGFVMKIDSPAKVEALQQLFGSLSEVPEPEEVMYSSPTILSKEAFVSEAYMAGFDLACKEFVAGTDPSAFRLACRGMLMRAPTPSSAAFAAGNLAAAYLLEEAEREPASRDGEYTIVEERIRCACGCGKTVAAVARGEGLVDIDLVMNGREPLKIITLSPDGAKELAEQLLDARGC